MYPKKYLAGKKLQPIPERRPGPEEREKKMESALETPSKLSKPVWRCNVCGYLCARDAPPEVCPICKVSSDRFERFM
jgi:rubrerythrin